MDEQIKELKEQAYKIATDKYIPSVRVEAMKSYALLCIAENERIHEIAEEKKQ